jgi:putative ABC transport system permease protein
MISKLFYFKYDLHSALQHFKKKWIHSILSVLGIIISISSIIVMISIGDGAKKKTLQNIQNLGINTIRIINKPFSNISNLNSNLSNGLNKKDLNYIESLISRYGYSSMSIKLKDKSVYFSDGDMTSLVIGSDNRFHLIEQLDILKGRPIIENDILNYSKVALISKDIAYLHRIKTHDNIIFNNNIFSVSGIIDTKDNLNNFILVPYNVFGFSNKRFDEINIFIEDKKNIFLLANIIRDKLLLQHKEIEDFIINIPLKIIEKEQEVQSTFNTVLLSIAIMSLLTGGISVMNAVLSNINEQTREIGLKLALGATPLRIVRFYLLYTVLLTIIGGVLGGIFGYIILFVLSVSSKLYIVFSLKAFFLGIVMSIVSGIVFGIYPALRASKIEPILSLREF